MNAAFYEQLGSVTGAFDQWGACERTVVACALVRRVPWPGLRLLQRTVDAALRHHVSDDRLEREANDEKLLASLLAPSENSEDDGCDRIRQLLTLLPFLHIDNERCKDVYVNATPALVQRCVDGRAAELCRQLLSYLLVHPALTVADQRTLTQWLRYLENHISGNRNVETVWQQRIDPNLLISDNIWAANNTFRRTIGKNVEFRSILDTIETGPYCSDILQESFSKNGRDVDISLEGEKLNFDVTIGQPKQRSNSLTPPSTNFMQMSSSAENLSDEPFQKPRSFSLSSEHSLSQLRPIAGAYTTGSETRLDDLRCNNFTEHPGMSMVAQWLKGLRLHKYVWLFTNMSYEQMIAMDDKYLEKLGVTKGARHKLLLSIKKLGEREAAVAGIEAELRGGGAAAVRRALDRLRNVLVAPMPPDSNLPTAIVRALVTASKAIACTSPSGAVSDGDMDAVDPLSLHCWLVDKALQQDVFASRVHLAESLRALRHRLPPRQFLHRIADTHHKHKHRWRMAPHNGYPRTFHKRAWTPKPPPPRGKSHSYPPGPAPPLLRAPPPPRPPPDDYSSLDALCLQMTEQAIN